MIEHIITARDLDAGIQNMLLTMKQRGVEPPYVVRMSRRNAEILSWGVAHQPLDAETNQLTYGEATIQIM